MTDRHSSVKTHPQRRRTLSQHVPFPLDENAIVAWVKTTVTGPMDASPLGSIYYILIGNGEIDRAIGFCKKFEGQEIASFCGVALIQVLIDLDYFTEARTIAQWTTDQMHPSLNDALHPCEAFLIIAEHTKCSDDIKRAESALMSLPEDHERLSGFQRLADIQVDRTTAIQTSTNN